MIIFITSFLACFDLFFINFRFTFIINNKIGRINAISTKEAPCSSDSNIVFNFFGYLHSRVGTHPF